MVTHAPAPASGTRRNRDVLSPWQSRLVGAPLLWLGVGLAVTLVLLNLGGLLYLATGRFGELLNIDSDIRFRWPIWESRINVPPSLVNAIVLTSAGLLLRRYDDILAHPHAKRFATFVGFSLVFMAADEFFMIHERLDEWTGIHWQTLYAPLVLIIGLATAAMLWQWWKQGETQAAALFVAGGASWFVAQVLEMLQFDDNHVPVDGYWGYVFVEEALEFTGSCFFLFAAIVLLRSLLNLTQRRLDA